MKIRYLITFLLSFLLCTFATAQPYSSSYGAVTLGGDHVWTGTNYWTGPSIWNGAATFNDVATFNALINISAEIAEGARYYDADGDSVIINPKGFGASSGVAGVRAFEYKDGATSFFVIDTTGKVGIGTATPYAQLSQVGATPIYYLTDSDVNKSRTSLATATDTSAIIFDASAAQPTITVKNSTGLGYTLTSIAAGGVETDGTIKATSFQAPSATGIWTAYQAGGGAFTFRLGSNNASLMAISSIGNVNIGASTAVDTQSPDLIITGDADSDGTDLTQSQLTLQLVGNANPTSSYWNFSDTYSATRSYGNGYKFDGSVVSVSPNPLFRMSDTDGGASMDIRNISGNFELYQASAGFTLLKVDQTSYNLNLGATTAVDNKTPDFIITGDADSDGTATTTEALTISLTSNATPTSATWAFTSTQGAGYTFDKDVSITGDLTVTGAISGGGYATMGFADKSQVITIGASNTYYKIDDGSGTLFTAGVNSGVTVQGDSMQVSAGDYFISWDISYSGANTDNYHIALFVDGVEQAGKGETNRGMSGTDPGVSSASTILTLSADDWISLRIKNTANTNNPTISAGNLTIQRK